MTTKCVDFAYPTSPAAKDYKCYKTGCYTITLYDSEKNSSRSVAGGYKTQDEAILAAHNNYSENSWWHGMIQIYGKKLKELNVL